ncbi:MAG: DNA primase [Candidatus Pacebacteria bacterium]|nr:DNA primase [Candidatus Paceibacterota bacterium]
MSSGTVEKIKERLGIADVIGSYLKLEKAGANMKARCPFHNEKTPSFFVSVARNSYYCFGCGAKGDIFTFVEEFEGLDFMGALRVLAQRAGVPLVEESPKEKSERDELYAVMKESARFFQENLAKNKEALLYLKKRGLKIETVRDWQIGFAPLDWRTLFTHLKNKGYNESVMEKAGLVKKAEANEESKEAPRLYDRFRGRVMFPIFDSSGRVIAFSGRILLDDGKSAKYLNSPDTPLFNKSEVLYGYHVAKWEIKKQDFSILVEGQMDLLMSQQAGCINTVAVSGTALTVQHLSMLGRLSKKVVLAFDADSAGFSAAERSARVALSLGMEVKMVEIKSGKDPADLILANPEDWKVAVGEAIHIIDFLLHKVVKDKIDERKLGQEIRKKVLPYVVSLESRIEQSHFVRKISDETRIPEDAIWEDLKKTEGIKEENAEELKIEKKEENNRRNKIEEKLIGLILWQESLPKPTIETSSIKKEFEKFAGKEALKRIEEAKGDKNDMIFEAETFFSGALNLEKDVQELLFNLKEDYLKKEFSKTMNELVQAERDKSNEKAAELLKKCKEIGEELTKLRKSIEG